MSQLVAVSSPASGREMLERAMMLRRTFFPRKPLAHYRPQAVVVYATPVEISRPPPNTSLAQEAAEIAAMAGKRIRVIDILCATAEHFNVRKMDLVSARRNKPLIIPRHVVMYLSRELTQRTLLEIGKLIGNRDHSSVFHGINRIEALIAAGDPVAGAVDVIRERLLA